MTWSGVTRRIDQFDGGGIITTTADALGWAAVLTGTTPTATRFGDGAKLTLTNTSEAQLAVLYHKDILSYDLASIIKCHWVVKLDAVDAVTNLAIGLASAHNATLDSVATNAWFRLIGATSTTAIVVETDDGVTDIDDVATGVTLAGSYKKFEIDFSQGLADVRFLIAGARVARGTTFDMSGLTSGLNVQPYFSHAKASGTGVPISSIAQFEISYRWSY
jgi:hypothetical protein